MEKFYNLTKAVILAEFFFGSLLSVNCQTIQLGTGTTQNGTNTSSPVNIYYKRTVSQFVYTAAELSAAGISGGCTLQDLGWFVTQSPLYDIPGYTVKLKHVSVNNVSVALITGGWTTVKSAFTYNPSAGGWDMLGLSTQFTWNGTDNIGVEVCWSQVTPSYNTSGQCKIYSTSSGYRYSWTDAAGSSCGSTPSTVNTNKPQVQMVWGCGPPCVAPGPPTASGTTVTCGAQANLVATGTPNGGTYNWYSDAGGTILVGTGNVFSTPVLSSSTVYYVASFVPSNCESTLVPVTVNVTSNVALPTANNVNVSCGSSATVSASGSTGNYTWFSDSNGSNSIGSGTSLSLGNLTSDTIVYVAASSSNGASTTLYTQNWQAGQVGWTETNSSPYWERLSGQTGSSNTGPTGGSNNGIPTTGDFYMYLETSTGAGTSFLTSPSFTVSGQATFQFDYHMYGAAMGTLSVEAFNGTSWTQVWTLFGQQQTSLGAPWTTVSIPLTGYSGAINVRFVGIRGGSYTSDMAVDNIVLTETQPGCQSTLVAVTATVDPIPSPTVTGTAQICASNSTTLSATGSSLEWYSDVNGTNVVGTGNSFATPVLTTNTTYYVGEAQSGQTYDQTILINSGLSGNNAINFPGTPVGATGTPTLTIKVFGDIDGVGGNLEQWLVNDESGSAVGTAGGTGNFSDQCGTVITTVVNLSTANIDNWASNGSIDFAAVDPTGNISYTLCGGDYVQLQLTYSSGSPCSSSLAQVDITVTDLPIVNAGTDQTICLGNSAQLSGVAGTSTSYQWSQPSSLSSAIILNPLATPAITTIYTLTGTINGCSASDNIEVILPTPSNNLSANNSSQTCVVKENNFIHFMDPVNNDLIASVNSGGQNLGNVTITSYENGLTQDIESCSYPGNLVFTTAAMGRHWVVTSEFQPTSSVEVLLPYHISQFDATAFAANLNQNPDDNLLVQYDLGCTKYSGINENAIFTDNCNNGTFTWHTQNSNAAVSTILSAHTSTDYFVTVSVDGFSEFWLHGSQNLVPLPVELTSFNANCMSDNKIEVSWSTASEYNASHFIIERSINDGEDWGIVQEVDAIGFSQVESLYSIEDLKSSINRPMYYRLRQFDIDGSQNEEKVISIDCSDQHMMLHPNPGNGKVTVQLYSPVKDDNSIILIEDLRGGRVLSIPANLKKGSNQIFFDVSGLTSGMYMVKIVGAHFSSATQKYIKH